MISYHFAILRYVHDVSTEEFVNIGVVMWIPKHSKLMFDASERFGRISGFFTNLDGPIYRQMVRDLKWASREVVADYTFKDGANHPFEIFHEIVQEDSSCFQWSRLMSGISEDVEKRFEELFEEFVTSHESSTNPQRRTDAEIWAYVRQALKTHHLAGSVKYRVKMEAQSYNYSFRMGWNNGTPQVLEPISFALKEGTKIVDKANTWYGRLFNLSKSNDFGFTAVVAPPQNGKMKPYNDGLTIMKGASSIRAIITQDEVNDYMSEIKNDLSTQREAPILI